MKLYTVVTEQTQKTLLASVNTAGRLRVYPCVNVLLDECEYSAEDFERLTEFVSQYHYCARDLCTEWVGNADPTPYDTYGDEIEESVCVCDVVVKDGEVYGLIKKSPYNDEYQIVTKDRFSGCHFSFRDPDKGDADNRYYFEYTVKKN